MLMRDLGRWVVAAVLLAGLAGCGMERPRLFHPGPAAYQQKKAERFDPYADNDIGPEVVGARPRDYQKPIPEPSRARWTIPPTDQQRY
jgi:predicted small lipoprotein YifL